MWKRFTGFIDRIRGLIFGIYGIECLMFKNNNLHALKFFVWSLEQRPYFAGLLRSLLQSSE